MVVKIYEEIGVDVAKKWMRIAANLELEAEKGNSRKMRFVGLLRFLADL